MSPLGWQVTTMTAYAERGVYELERDRSGTWDLYFTGSAREWPTMQRIALVQNDERGNVVDFASLEEALAFANRHAESFAPQMRKEAV